VEAVDRVWWRSRGTPPAADAEPLHMLAFVGRDARFVDLLDHSPTLGAIVDLLGWNVFMYHCHLDVHPPATGRRHRTWKWHQDGGPQNRDIETRPRPRLSVKIAYFLTDVSEPGRGNLVVIPGSHLRDEIERPRGRHNDLAGAVPVLAHPGTAVMFDRRLWHMRSENRSTLTRKALFYAYTFRWVRARDDLHLPPELFPAITPVRAQLLGAGTGAIGHWLPAEGDVPLRAWWEERAGKLSGKDSPNAAVSGNFSGP
jgi:ectoine hydroxylase-related dioxygenase (phytanoyl-CoA dioxygenase family)